MFNKTSLRNFLGELPLAAELDYALRHAWRNRARKDHFNLSHLKKSLPHAVEQVKPIIQNSIRNTQYAVKTYFVLRIV